MVGGECGIAHPLHAACNRVERAGKGTVGILEASLGILAAECSANLASGLLLQRSGALYWGHGERQRTAIACEYISNLLQISQQQSHAGMTRPVPLASLGAKPSQWGLMLRFETIWAQLSRYSGCRGFTTEWTTDHVYFATAVCV